MSGTPPFGHAAAARAADAVRNRIGEIGEIGAPVLGVVLGSGLGGLADRVDRPTVVGYDEVPGFPRTAVAGHAGRLIAGTIAGRPVVALSGRFHPYEGHPPALASFPIRVLHALGARTLLVSNAAGGIRGSFRPGDLMLITDQINFAFRNPLIGAAEHDEPRFPDMSEPYDRETAARLRACAREIDLPLAEGVYCGLLGPSYETQAEIRMLSVFGADAVGMSTVSEVIVARALGMRVAGLSCITNVAAGLSPHPLSHTSVLETTARVAARLESLVERFVASL
ncbi:MAG TPA: purine-nucleoside phosphorylase [Gemmatimonadaceae bacterium]|nr:purine-nucleoside phosphorylase [Gemmatimonadaceae bacterium]